MYYESSNRDFIIRIACITIASIVVMTVFSVLMTFTPTLTTTIPEYTMSNGKKAVKVITFSPWEARKGMVLPHEEEIAKRGGM